MTDAPTCAPPIALPVVGGPACGDGGPPEWALVELQGSVEPPAGTEPGADFTAGKLELLPSGAVQLTVGMHALTGSTTKLDKPLAVLEKVGGGGMSTTTPADENVPPTDAVPSPPVHYRVVGVVRRKCLFKARPQTLIGRAQG